MNQTGVKNASAEQPRADSKRERRRGAAGRAAALRRAPSDSDCSGETASLSADSGDRVLRPLPPPPRSGKSRSRRRGSEWEVLEGLKDGQRFEKRPDVFNGYLQKKRKWPLKGWHKRFFVIDGGILVYARSPTDVARGRLHGSVDVGLSVISAKARRRRIDIDADEFIYHLRAKTPELFRTWLNVLKTHRLYRQHLLTFGARESVPKIHAPLDDMPPTDTSSRYSDSSTDTSKFSLPEDNVDFDRPFPNSPKRLCKHELLDSRKNEADWNFNVDKDVCVCNCQTGQKALDKVGTIYNKSLCSMNCARMLVKGLNLIKSPDMSPGSTDGEKQINETDLNSLKSISPHEDSEALCNVSLNSNNKYNKPLKTIEAGNKKDVLSSSQSHVGKERDELMSKLADNQQAAAFFLFTRNKNRSCNENEVMKRSNKSTNLVKYRNIIKEPTLKAPLSNLMLLGKYKLKISKQVVTAKAPNRAVACEPIKKENNEVQVKMENEKHVILQDSMTNSDCDNITEKLMVSLFESHNGSSKGDEAKFYINQVIKDLYDIKLNKDLHPLKALFRNLLEYWLRNTSIGHIREAMNRNKSVSRQSNRYFTKDEKLSSAVLDTICKATQFHGLSDLIIEMRGKINNAKQIKEKIQRRNPPKCRSPKRDTESFEKERKTQELERLLKNTVYMCETGNSQSREKDIKITKTLIDNIGKLSRRSNLNKCNDGDQKDTSNSSTELSKIQETINHLISETSLPPDVAKEFLNVYLDVLLHNTSRSVTDSSTQSSDDIDDTNQPICDVETEKVTKKLSKSVITSVTSITKDINERVCGYPEKTQSLDPGQQYLKDMLDKMTTIFYKGKKNDNKWSNISKDQIKTQRNIDVKDELGRSVIEEPEKNIVHHNYEDNSVIIDISKYDLEQISMFRDPAVKGITSVTIKLKEKSANFTNPCKHLGIKFPNDSNIPECEKRECLSYIKSSDTSYMFNKLPVNLNKNRYIGCPGNDLNNLKPYLSSSEATSKAYRIMNESNHLLDLSFKSSQPFHNESMSSKKSVANNGTQSCYIMSSLRNNAMKTKFQAKKKVRLKKSHGSNLNFGVNSPTASFGQKYEKLSVFDKPTPKIIDERFILLLLENLTLLSKGVPCLNKDINNLYLKLKKKCEKYIRNDDNVQGLSLLGKIYTEGSSKTANETQTHVKVDVSTDMEIITENTVNIAINTSAKNDTKIKMMTNKSINVFHIDNKLNVSIQTEDILKFTNIENFDSASTFTNSVGTCFTPDGSPKFTTSSTIQTAQQATSNPNWLKQTKECSVSTAIQYLLNSHSSENFRITQELTPISIERDTLRKNSKTPPKIRRDLMNEVSFLTPFNASRESQTDWYLQPLLKKPEKDFNVYQLFVSNQYTVKKSSSVTMANAKLAPSDDLKTIYRCSSVPSYCSGLISPTSPPIRGPQFVSGTPGGRLASWIIESGGPLENASRELGQAQLSIQQMQRLLDALEIHHQIHHDTDVSIEGASPSVKKDRRKFGLRKKKSNSKCASVELAPPHGDLSSSHLALSTLTAPPSPGGGASSAPNSAASLPIACAAARPQSLPGAEALGPAAGPASLTSLTPDHQLREDFTILAKDLLGSLKTIVATLVCERGRLRAAMEASDPVVTPGGSVMSALRTNLTSALQQNSELRSRLSRIHLASDIAEISSIGANSDPQAARPFQQSLSYSSSCVSASEFFDAEEHEDDELKSGEVLAGDEAGVIELDGDSSSEAGSLSSEEGSASSDNSEGAMLSAEQETLRATTNGVEGRPDSGWRRRTRLPAARPTPGGPSLWNLLYKNIGKDLSQISMPVTINEPLNMLQRLCEELEYCSLLDSAAECGNAVERMALVAAFAVSAYAATAHRAASKPFNPLLAETYECRRDDRAFLFLAEQVSHHPPISACHAESPRWCFWQEARIKTKFWGKSMEFQPTGRVHVRLTTTGDHYSWNKVTTCVHNLFGGQRWVDQYGDMHITCHGTDIGCKLNFIKASSWSSSRHEVRGAVSAGSTRLRLSGRWSEALYAGDSPAARCLWRPGAMPPEHELYYGFTRFAMELNELEPGMREVLPHTDTRLRPDQRALEEGDVDAAEQLKHELEQAQRDRRRDCPNHTPAWFRKTLESGEETWVFTGEYWKSREAGFPGLQAPRIW